MTFPMQSLLASLVLACALALGGAAHATEAEVQAHVDAATRAAGKDLASFMRLCQPASRTRPVVSDESPARLIATPGPAAQPAFDNLVYLGSGWVSAWALKTQDGLVLIDALNTVDEVDRLIAGGLRSVGLDPAQIKAVLVTHGHGDHYGGVERVKQLTQGQARVVMSQLDWRMTASQLEFASPLWPAPPRFDAQRDVAAADGDTFRHGGAELLLPQTPGHTLGTISPIFEVQSGARRWRAVIWGGTGFNFGRDLDRLDAYIRSTERMQQLVRQHQVEVLLSNHPSFDGTVAKLAALRSGAPSEGAHPYVVGTDTVLRALTVAGECARANKLRFLMQP